MPTPEAPYYSDSSVTIYHGDCREILPLLPKVGLVLTDPPYAIGAGRGEWSATAAVAIGLHEAAKRVEKRGALLAFTTTSGRGIEFTQGAIAGKLPFNRLLVWSKVGGRSRAISPWRWDSVAIMAFGSAPLGRQANSSVFQSPAEYPHPSQHPAELPNGIAEWLFEPFDRDGILTLDPFMGTGRLLEPSVKRGHRVIGIEIEERYCEIAAQRLSQEVLKLGGAA
jgi:DNA modification methylase